MHLTDVSIFRRLKLNRMSRKSRKMAFSSPLAIILIISFFPSFALGEPRTFIIRNTSSDLDQFRQVAELAAQLRPYGRVQMEISALADKSWYEIPPGGSPWHEYGCYIAAPWKFFPHPKIAPHIPADWVEANRELMLKKVEILRKLGLEAMAYWKNSHILPESFFEQYPHLRGPRVDHPRRSKREEFVWCTDLAETRGMIEWMMSELKRNVPELQVVFTGTNDSGSGLCWAAAQYPGPNGPGHCKGIGVGERVRTLSKTVHRGAVDGGGEVTQRWGHTNLWANEMEIVLSHLPPRTFINSHDPSLVITGTLINEAFPIRGMIDPLATIEQITSLGQPGVDTLLLMYCQEFYGRGDESPKAVEKHLEIVLDCIRDFPKGLQSRLDRLDRFAQKWGGQTHGAKLFEAFYDLHNAMEITELIAPAYRRYIRFCPVSLRYMTRPLLLRPDVLSTEEETYFLPYVFNVNTGEARNDYIDLHGSGMTGVADWNNPALRRALASLLRTAEVLQDCPGAPAERWLTKMGIGIQIWVSELRSIHNFYHAQLIRDRNAELLNGPPAKWPKEGSWTGHPDNLPWNSIQRDEFDNVGELISLLENGGRELLITASDSQHEDTFLLGPDLLAALTTKRRLMRQHWLDAQSFLYPPLK